jgi:hypothetical protein
MSDSKDAATALEDWRNSGGKGRWCEIAIANGYGATCWEVILGNTGVRRKPGWFAEKSHQLGSTIYASEVSFFVHDESQPENVVIVKKEDDEEDWPGLSKTIFAALDRAKELGI